MTRNKKRNILPEDFEPNEHSVLCGRGNEYTNFVGNQWFRTLVTERLQRYSQARSRAEKSNIVQEVFNEVRNSGGIFARFDQKEGVWFEVRDGEARDKVGSQFREFLHSQYKSSSKAKTAKKKAKRSGCWRAEPTAKTKNTTHKSYPAFDSLDECSIVTAFTVPYFSEDSGEIPIDYIDVHTPLDSRLSERQHDESHLLTLKVSEPLSNTISWDERAQRHYIAVSTLPTQQLIWPTSNSKVDDFEPLPIDNCHSFRYDEVKIGPDERKLDGSSPNVRGDFRATANQWQRGEAGLPYF